MNMNKRATELNHRARVRAGSNRPRESVELDPAEAEASASPPPMDSGLGCTGWTGSGGGAGSRDNPYTVGGGGASAAAWTRLVSSGLEDELVGVAGAGGGRAGALSPPQLPQGHFLDACFLCRKPLASNRDIFMYRGDMPFCTEECRREQIERDEKLERKETTSKKVAQRASSPKDVESSPRPPKARAGSILAG